MKYIIFTLFFILYYLTRYRGSAVQINVLSYTFDEFEMFQKSAVEDEFNKYSLNNKLNVTLNIEMMKFESPGDSYDNFRLLVESLLKKSVINNDKFDLYFYDLRFSDIYGPYLLDLKEYLPEEYLQMYNSRVVNETCYYKNKLVGLPFYISYEILYSNKELLSDYDVPIPETWDEMIKICNYIMKYEKDPDLICYNGLFDDSEQGLYSLIEFIYSCRDSINSTYPNPQDQSFRDSLIMLKKLKDDTASDIIFRSNENFAFKKLTDRKSIFVKYWLVGEPFLGSLKYTISALPGMKKGISGTSISGNSIGIIKNIKEDKREAALEVLKFFTSKSYQKELFRNGYCLTAIDELFYDEQVCKKNGLCDTFRDIQFTVEPEFMREGQSLNYEKKYKKYIYRYLYDDISLETTLKQINDISKIYYVSLDTENSYVGLVCFVFFSVVTVGMIVSLVFLFRENFRPFFMFLSEDFWIITVLGSVIILWIPYTDYGLVTERKCLLKVLLMTIGYTFNICPTIYKLIVQFPEENRIFNWIHKHKYLFLLINLSVDLLILSTFLLNPVTSTTISIEDGETFKTCHFSGEYSIVLLFIYKLLIIILMLLFIFVEWNISSTMDDIKFIISALYIDILSIILIYIFHLIKIKYYLSYFLLQATNTSIISIFNYLLFYGIRLILAFIKKQNIRLKYISSINEKFINNETQLQSRMSDNGNISCNPMNNSINGNEECGNSSTVLVSKSSNFIARMIDYHYTPYSSLDNINNPSYYN